VQGARDKAHGRTIAPEFSELGGVNSAETLFTWDMLYEIILGTASVPIESRSSEHDTRTEIKERTDMSARTKR
jgi:hypothetical protein